MFSNGFMYLIFILCFEFIVKLTSDFKKHIYNMRVKLEIVDW